MKITSQMLLESYQNLWHDRTLPVGLEAEKTLHRTITIELLDDLTHPRLRKTLNEKYLLGIERVVNSTLELEQKVELINLYTQIRGVLNNK